MSIENFFDEDDKKLKKDWKDLIDQQQGITHLRVSLLDVQYILPIAKISEKEDGREKILKDLFAAQEMHLSDKNKQIVKSSVSMELVKKTKAELEVAARLGGYLSGKDFVRNRIGINTKPEKGKFKIFFRKNLGEVTAKMIWHFVDNKEREEVFRLLKELGGGVTDFQKRGEDQIYFPNLAPQSDMQFCIAINKNGDFILQCDKMICAHLRQLIILDDNKVSLANPGTFSTLVNMNFGKPSVGHSLEVNYRTLTRIKGEEKDYETEKTDDSSYKAKHEKSEEEIMDFLYPERMFEEEEIEVEVENYDISEFVSGQIMEFDIQRLLLEQAILEQQRLFLQQRFAMESQQLYDPPALTPFAAAAAAPMATQMTEPNFVRKTTKHELRDEEEAEEHQVKRPTKESYEEEAVPVAKPNTSPSSPSKDEKTNQSQGAGENDRF